MTETDQERSGGGLPTPEEAAPLRIFINYRHEDADMAALMLHGRLADRFGAECVFLDVKAIEPGSKWLEQIKTHGQRGSVFLALIGRGWLESLKQRQQRTQDGPEDYVLMELEFALARWPGKVIPVLVGGAVMPEAVSLPRQIRALAGYQAMQLRQASFEQDVGNLIDELERIAAQPAAAPEAATEPAPTEPALTPATPPVAVVEHAAAPADSSLPGPSDAHYETVLEYMIEEGTVVPVLGLRVRGSLPDAEQLADHLVSKFKLSQSRDLAEVAQHVAVARGPSFVFKEINELLRLGSEPTALHRLLARFPGRLEQLGLPPRYQMIVTTNYDSALEHAFEAENEPYDLAVFIAGGQDKGKFAHVPWKGEPRVITEASRYRELPIDPNDELERTVIVKVQGAADAREAGARGGRSYVLTEDQYIDYLVTDQIGSVVPLQILNKLTSSHCLFLGYAVRDWSLRVFLSRIWQGQPLDDKSWAIEHSPDELEKDFWSSLRVELLSAAPDDYAQQLDARLSSWPRGGG
jgi:SIR2-like domain/TIR domain